MRTARLVGKSAQGSCEHERRQRRTAIPSGPPSEPPICPPRAAQRVPDTRHHGNEAGIRQRRHIWKLKAAREIDERHNHQRPPEAAPAAGSDRPTSAGSQTQDPAVSDEEAEPSASMYAQKPAWDRARKRCSNATQQNGHARKQRPTFHEQAEVGKQNRDTSRCMFIVRSNCAIVAVLSCARTKQTTTRQR